MKEFEPIIDKEGDKTELSVPIPIEKQQKYQGTLILKKGLKCYEYSFITKEINEAQYESQAVDFGQTEVSRKIVMNKNCGYTVALNKKNAMRKLQKLHGFKLIISNP